MTSLGSRDSSAPQIRSIREILARSTRSGPRRRAVSSSPLRWRAQCKAMDLAYKITRRGGTTITAGLPPPNHTFALPQVNLVAEERTIKGSYIGTCVPIRDLPRYIELYRGGKLPVDRLMSGRLKLDEINLGFDRLHEGKAVRQVVVF